MTLPVFNVTFQRSIKCLISDGSPKNMPSLQWIEPVKLACGQSTLTAGTCTYTLLLEIDGQKIHIPNVLISFLTCFLLFSFKKIFSFSSSFFFHLNIRPLFPPPPQLSLSLSLPFFPLFLFYFVFKAFSISHPYFECKRLGSNKIQNLGYENRGLWM